MLRLLVALACLPLCGQVRVLFQPVALGVTDAALGKSGLGVWTVSAIVPPGSTVSRVLIMMAAPQLRSLPNRQATAILARGAFADKRTVATRVVTAAIQIAPMVLGVAGVATGSPGYAWAGVGTSALSQATAALKARAPDTAIITSADLLPDIIDHTGTWYVLASLMHNAAPIGPLEMK